MKRITAKDVLTAYKETGLIPTYGKTMAITDTGCQGCALTALITQELGGLPTLSGLESAPVQDFCELLDLDQDYADGFLNGFDDEFGMYDYGTTDLYHLGWKDGRSCHIAVFEKGEKT